MTGIVVGVDGSEAAGQALVWAVREGELHHWPVTAVMAWDWLAQGPTFDPAYDENDIRSALDAAIARVLDPPQAGAVERRVINDLATRALLDASRDASLLVVGTRGAGEVRGLLVGSVSQQCLYHSVCPVAVVRGHGDEPAEGAIPRIVVGVDGSATADLALAWAVQEARCRQAALDVVHAWHLPAIVGLSSTSRAAASGIEEAARVTLDAAIDRVDTADLDWPVNGILRYGPAASAILETATGADLIVVGSRGLGGFSGLLLGSVGSHVSNAADGTVVVIRPRPSER